MPANITLRAQLLGGVTEFCTESELILLRDTITLVELIVSLARYQEEGVSLRPEVYLTNNISGVMGMLPDGERVKLGVAAVDVDGMKMALKKSAPLSKDPWCIYMDIGERLEYGLFRGAASPAAVATDDVLLDGSAHAVRVVKASCVAAECVEVRSNVGGLHRIFLDHRKEESPPPLQYLDDLIVAITKEVVASEKEYVSSFFKKMISKALRDSHGALLAVTTGKNVPAFLKDGTVLDDPMDFTRMLGDLKARRMDLSMLEAKRSLIEGMFQSDGIVVFDKRGRLLGFNCFVKTTSSNVIGGARKRAFAALASKVGNGLVAAFIQSQDGWTDFKKGEV